MPFVSRDLNGIVDGLYETSQPGFAEEFLEDNDPEVLAYIASIPPYALQADVPWVRMTDAEADLVQTGLDGLTTRMRNIIIVSTVMLSSTEAFTTFRDVIIAATSVSRADEILEKIPPL